MKVSFDFDGTLEHEEVQQYAKELIKRGIEVWIVTTRYDANHQHKWLRQFPDAEWALIYDKHNGDPNHHVWGVAERLGIPKHHVRFTCMEWKWTYLKGTKFVWHLDDNPEEIVHGRANHNDVPMIEVTRDDWKQRCDDLIGTWIKTHQSEPVKP